jgi:hypothetical protein
MRRAEFPPRPDADGKPSPGRHAGDRRARGARVLLVGLTVLAWLVVAPAAARPVAAAGDPVIAAAGDIACDPLDSHYNFGNGTVAYCMQKATSDLLANGGFAAVLALGDTQYYCGGLAAFQQVYDATWGRVKSITHPVVGNHEYLTTGSPTGATGCDNTNANAAGYYSYFGAAAGDRRDRATTASTSGPGT